MVASAVGDPSTESKARHHEVVALDPRVSAQCPESVGHAREPIRLLGSELGGAR